MSKISGLKAALKQNRSIQVNVDKPKKESPTINSTAPDPANRSEATEPLPAPNTSLNAIAIQLRNQDIETLNAVCNTIKTNRPRTMKKERITKSSIIRCLISILEHKMPEIDLHDIGDEAQLLERLKKF